MVLRRVALVGRLESVAKWWRVETEFQQEPTPSQLEERYTRIEWAAHTLLRELGASDTGGANEMPPALRFGSLQAQAAIDADHSGNPPTADGAELLEDRVKGISQIQDWARRAGDRERAKGGTPRAERHDRDDALDRLLGGLIGIWVDIFGRPPGMSVAAPERRNAGLPGGPMLRFIDACLTPLLGQVKPSTDAIRSRIRRMGISTHKKS